MTENFDTNIAECNNHIAAIEKTMGFIPPLKNLLCTQDAEKEEYSRINWEMVGKISALESMLASAKKELLEANETISKLRAALSRYECRVKGE